MSTRGIILEVRAVPSPQGSKRHVGKGIMVESAGQKLKDWRTAVRQDCVAAMKDTGTTGWPSGPVAVSIVFLLPRPKAHYRTGKRAGELRLRLDRGLTIPEAAAQLGLSARGYHRHLLIHPLLNNGRSQ
jgi:hypothetical protein